MQEGKSKKNKDERRRFKKRAEKEEKVDIQERYEGRQQEGKGSVMQKIEKGRKENMRIVRKTKKDR